MKVNRVFALLIESGLIYCCTWVCLTSGKVDTHKRSHYTVADFILGLDVQQLAFSGLHRHGAFFSEYCTCVPSTHCLWH